MGKVFIPLSQLGCYHVDALCWHISGKSRQTHLAGHCPRGNDPTRDGRSQIQENCWKIAQIRGRNPRGGGETI